MKLTKEQANLFKETHDKWLTENSFLAALFARKVKKNIEKDRNIQKAVKDADKYLEKTRKEIEDKLGGSKEDVKDAIPQSVRKYLGFDY